MKPNKFLVCSLLFSILSTLSSCSGVKQIGPPPPPGTASLAVTLAAKPLTPPPGTSILSFSVDVTSIALTPSSGTAVSVPLVTGSGAFEVDLTRLQSDSVFLGINPAVPSGSYTALTLGVSNPVLTFCTVTSGTPGCTPGSITTITASSATPQATLSLGLTNGQATGLAAVLDFNKAITLGAAQTVSAVDLTASGVLSSTTLPRTSSLASGNLDFLEDITGVVTAVSSGSVTLQTATHGAFTATTSSSTVFSPTCLPATDITCVKIGQVASIDATVATDGTFGLLLYDPIDVATTPKDWIEGVITALPTSPTQFSLVSNDLVPASSGIVGSGLALSAPVDVTLASGAAFSVDVQGLTLPSQALTFAGAADATGLLPGQTVAVRVTGFTIASGVAPAKATVDRVELRFSRVPGSVATSAPPNTFSMQNLPAFFGLAINPVVQLSSSTNFDGIANASGIIVGTGTFTVRALYFGPAASTPFSAAKVRAN